MDFIAKHCLNAKYWEFFHITLSNKLAKLVTCIQCRNSHNEFKKICLFFCLSIRIEPNPFVRKENFGVLLIRYIPAFIFVYLFYLPFRILPYRLCLLYGRFLVILLYPFARKHRRIAYENISYAFPEYTESQKKELVWKSVLHIGNLVAGTLFAPRLNQKWMDRYLVYDPKSLEIEKKTNEEGVGVVLISGHFGTWEILVQFMGVRMKGGGIYKKVRNPLVDKLIYKLRTKNGIKLVSTEESSQVTKMLKQGYWIGFGSDQNAGKVGIFVNFFNRPASTYQGPALMAYRNNFV